MRIDVDIRVQSGRVTICVGGQSPSSAGVGALVAQGNVGKPANVGNQGGGDPANEDPGKGGGGPGGGTLVIGPIVVDCAVLQATNGQATANSGNQGGGDPANEDPGKGGGGPMSSGTMVIGPITICGQGSGGATSAAPPTSKAVAVDPRK